MDITPTWGNKRLEDDDASKGLDRFLSSKSLIKKMDRFRRWARNGGGFDHHPKPLQLDI